MASIREIVRSAIASGYISNAGIQLLRDLLKFDYEPEDIEALMRLNQAVVTGRVRQVANESHKSSFKPTRRGIVKMKLVCQTTFAAVIVGTIVFAIPKNSQQAVFNNDVNTMEIDIWQK
ncbi:MAG: hypothetical protein HC903_02935 [Methylacidiphilales bacterium]|nr:hypothetical protein [Candidatus Methylacidiphilales bacterium]NJR15996.1 hypothetical protein [Calothrix sp. CSU_2_0]